MAVVAGDERFMTAGPEAMGNALQLAAGMDALVISARNPGATGDPGPDGDSL